MYMWSLASGPETQSTEQCIAVRCFPDLCLYKILVGLGSVCTQSTLEMHRVKFGKDEIDLRLVRAVIEEDDNALARIDHLVNVGHSLYFIGVRGGT